MKILSRHWKVIWQSVLFGVLYWIIASVFEAFVFHERQFFVSLLSPAPHEFFSRLFALCFIAAVSFFITYRLSKEESALDEKEHFLEDVFESIQDGISILDTEMRIVRVNSQMEKWHGHSMPLIGKKCYEAYHNRSERCEVCPSWQTINTGKPAHGIVSIINEKGEIGWFDLFSFPLFDERTGTLKGVIEYVGDITTRKHTEESLLEINETLRTLVYASPLAIISIDKQCKVKFWGPAAEHIFGWKEDEVIGQLIPIMPQEKCFEFNEMQKNGRRSTSHKGIEMVCLKKDGSQIDVEGWAAPLRSYDNEVIGTIVLFADITERKSMELELVESEKKYRGLFEDLRDVIYMSTPDGRILDINEAGIKLLGYSSREEILNLNLGQDFYVYPEDRKKLIKLLNEKAFVDNFETILKKKNGEHIIVQFNVKAQKNKDGSLKFIRGIIRDITDKKKLEQQLLHSQKLEAIGQLAGGVAHDFNNILTAVIGYANLLKMKLKENDPSHAYADAVLSTAERGASLTQSLLTFGRKQSVELKPIGLNSVVERICKLLIRLIGEDVELKTMLSDNDITVMADSLQLEQVLMNLATNARDSMPDGGLLTIGTQEIDLGSDVIKPYSYMKSGRYALVSFTDTGMGMDENIKTKIFEPFFTTKEVGKGTGLGLSIVYGIIKQHQGYINVYSEKGKGTTFKIYLPLAQTGKIDEIQPENLKVSGMINEVILLGEDDKMVRKIIKTMLEEFGYKVIEASNGEETLNKFTENKDIVSLLLLDLIMPKKSGKEVFDEVKKIKPDIKVIFTSGYSADLINKDGIMQEGCSFISKPVSPTELLKLVEKVLGGKA